MSEFINSHARCLEGNNLEQVEAFTLECYNMAIQVVMDSDFSEAAQDLFPRLYKTDFKEMQVWWRLINLWYTELISAREQALFSKSQVIWQ